MLLRPSNHCASLVIMSMIALAPCARVLAQDDYVLSAPRFWWGNWAVPRWISLAGDADGDGRADLIAVEPGGTIALARTSPLGKWVDDPSRDNPFAGDLIAAAAARFTGGTGDEVLGLARDGSLHLSSRITRGTSKYARRDRVGHVPALAGPPAVSRALSADLNADGRPDVLVPCVDGHLLLLLNLSGERGMPNFMPPLSKGSHQGAIEIDLGRFGPTLAPRLIWLDRNGTLFAAAINFAGNELQAGTPERLLELGPGARLAVGSFLGRPSHDIIAGRRLLPGGEPGRTIELSVLPPIADSKSDPWWRSADIDGNGMDDLIRKRMSSDREGGPEIVITFRLDWKSSAAGFSIPTRMACPTTGKPVESSLLEST
jgi:hypothetical protein